MSKKKPEAIPLRHFLTCDSWKRNFSILMKEEPNADNYRLIDAFLDETTNVARSDMHQRAEIKKRRAAGGKATAQQKQEALKKRNNDIEAQAVGLRNAKRPEHEIASLIAATQGLTSRHIRTILNKQGFYRK